MQLRRRPGHPVRALLLTVAAMTVVAGATTACGQSGAAARGSHSSAPAYVASCGTAKSAADVPVQVKIARGHASCGTAMTVEAAYATAIRSGREPGNGGGGPVKVDGWTCRGFATPVVDNTGKASECVRDGNEILEIVVLATPSPSSSPSSS